MIVHRGEIDAGLRDDVAQRHVAEAAIGIEPLGGGENGRPRMIAGHGFKTSSFRGATQSRTRNLAPQLRDSGFDASPRPGMTREAAKQSRELQFKQLYETIV